MENIKSKAWWEASATRAIKTMAQTVIAMIGTAVVISDVDWKYVASAVVVAGVLSLATSLAGLPEVAETFEIDYDEETLDEDDSEELTEEEVKKHE